MTRFTLAMWSGILWVQNWRTIVLPTWDNIALTALMSVLWIHAFVQAERDRKMEPLRSPPVKVIEPEPDAFDRYYRSVDLWEWNKPVAAKRRARGKQ